jgi:hypothetical protein
MTRLDGRLVVVTGAAGAKPVSDALRPGYAPPVPATL